MFSLLSALCLERSFQGPYQFHKRSRTPELLSENDLGAPIPKITSKDELGRLAKALERTVTFVISYISDIENVLTNIADGNLDIETTQEYIGDFSPIKSSG